MSLIKQLWLAIGLITTLAFAGSFVVSTLSARQYLEQELAVKNNDNASSIALSMSQMDKDAVTVELQLAAQFDTGHYRLIRLQGPDGAVLAEREFEGPKAGAPQWLIDLVPIESRPGIAQVQDGWHQFGTLTVQTHNRYAYDSLWRATRELLVWFLAAGLLTGLVGSVALRVILRPLRAVVDQARAIGDRRFVTIDAPRTTEFRSVVGAMNALSARIRVMLSEESQRLDQLRKQTQMDELTGLYNRSQFLNQLDAALNRNDDRAGGTLFFVRLARLADLNQRCGRAAADRLLAALGTRLSAYAANFADSACGRMNASDFALLTPGTTDRTDGFDALLIELRELAAGTDAHVALFASAAHYAPDENRGQLLARLDAALATTEHRNALSTELASERAPARLSLEEWRGALEDALDLGHFSLARFPVLATDGSLLHHTAPIRLQLDGDWLDAGRFLPWAARTGMLERIDARALELAIAALEADRQAPALAIHLSAGTIGDTGFATELLQRLRAHAEVCDRLWFDILESSALRHQDELRLICPGLRALGCKVGLKHAGEHFSRFAELHDLGMDYIKIDAALIGDIDSRPGNQALVRGMSTVAHSIGMLAIAEGLRSAGEEACVIALGVDGMTGPGIQLPA